MQNSKLSTIIVPSLSNSWQKFISKVKEELNSVESTNTTVANRINELKDIIPRVKEACEESKDNIEKILKYRDAFVAIDNNLSSCFDALEFFKSQNNLDNDAAKTIYERIVKAPIINELSEEYSGLLIKKDYAKKEIKPLLDLIRGKKYDQDLIKELLNKYNFDEKTKKDVLLYSLVSSSVKQNEVKEVKEEKKLRKKEQAEAYRDKIRELIDRYQNKKNELTDLFNICYGIKKRMTPDTYNMYKGYISNPSEALRYGFDDDAMLMIYTMSFFKIKEDIEDYIEGISDLEIDNANLSGEVSFFEELINEFGMISEKIKGLYEEEEEIEDDDTRKVFFALDPFNRLIPSTSLLANNKNSINTFIKKVNSSNNHIIDGINVVHMQGVEEIEELLGKTVYLLSTSNYKMPYIMINDCVLVLAISSSSDTKFNNAFSHIVKGGLLPIRRQMALIEDRNQDYIDLENDLLKDILSEKEKQI